MKLILSISAGLLFAFSSFAQSAYYDALTLRRYISPDGIFAPDGKEKDTLLTILNDRYSYHADNPFIKPFFSTGKGLDITQNTYEKILPGAGDQLTGFDMSKLGSFNVTTIADGFAKFIVTRTKQELNIAFFYRFQQEIEKEEYRDMRSIFPQTYRALSAMGSEIYNYEGYLQTLRECFKNDLNNLPTNLPLIVDNHPKFFAAFPELAAYLNSGCYIASEINLRSHPGDILGNFPINYLDSLSPNIKGSLQTLQLISASLRESPEFSTNYWVNSSQLKMLINDELAFRIYLGLIYEQALQPPYNSIHYSNTTAIAALKSLAENFDPNFKAYAQYINQFGYRANKLNVLLENYRKPANDSLAVEMYATFANASIDLFRYAAEAGKLPYINLPYLADSLCDFFDVAQTSCDLALAANRHNYGVAVVSAAHIYDVVINRALAKPENKNRLAMVEIVSPETRDKIFKYGSLMASVAQAKTSAEVKMAIEAIALPPGSARIKRESEFNVSVNAYCGVFGGYEKINGLAQDDNFKVNSYGITAPIGFALSRGHSIFFAGTGKKSWGWSSSLFVSVVDIGALTAFRFTNDSTETVPKIELQNIISPGIFYSLGIPKSPISINVGYQVGPLLRKVTATKNDYDKSYGRFSLSICVDLPILNLYNKPR